MTVIELSRKLDELIEDTVEEPEDKQKHRFTLPKVGALLGAGGITGAGIATGSVATRTALTALGKKIRKAVGRQIVVQIKRPRR